MLSGWDEQLGGGIWWHQRHKDGTKNACANGPAAVGCLRLARFREADEAAALVDGPARSSSGRAARSRRSDGLFDDRKVVATGEVKRGKLTYNSALMLRALLGLYRATGEKEYLDEAKRIGKAADWFLDAKTGVYRDPLKWSHFMVEADLELYRATKEDYLLQRARRNADAFYERGRRSPPEDMMSNAAIAPVLWLMAETETDAGASVLAGVRIGRVRSVSPLAADLPHRRRAGRIFGFREVSRPDRARNGAHRGTTPAPSRDGPRGHRVFGRIPPGASAVTGPLRTARDGHRNGPAPAPSCSDPIDDGPNRTAPLEGPP